MMTSENLNDGKAAIPLLKKFKLNLPDLLTAGLFNAGYDFDPIYQQLADQGLQAVISYSRRNEGEVIGFDENSFRHLSWIVPIVPTSMIPNTIN